MIKTFLYSKGNNGVKKPPTVWEKKLQAVHLTGSLSRIYKKKKKLKN